MDLSLTILVSCYNEQDNIKSSIIDLNKYFKDFKYPFTILIIDDGSNDDSLKVIKSLKKNEKKHLEILKLKKNVGLGNSYREGVINTKTSHLVWFPGDNEISAQSVRKSADLIKNYDLILMYPENDERSKLRKIISFTFTSLLNFIMKEKIYYYNGSNFHNTKLLKTLDLSSSGFEYQSYIIVQLLMMNTKFIQRPYYLNYISERNRALSIKNIILVLKFLFKTFIHKHARG